MAPTLRHLEQTDLISEPTAQIERRVEQMLPELNRERERLMIERIKEAAYAEGRSSLGVHETLQALEEGRVEHLVYDAGATTRTPNSGWRASPDPMACP